jgi:hypothetical protein
MKNLIKSFFLSLIGMTFLTNCEKEEIISSLDLPVEINSYISTHFPNKSILQVIKDKDGLIKSYDILLNENVSLEFNRKNEIIDIDGNTKLPDSVIPDKILQFVALKYAANFVTDWQLDGNNQQVELDNGLDLEFNIKGEFLRIDN